MPTVRISITMPQELLYWLDEAVQERRFPSRSLAIQEALRQVLGRRQKRRLARECAKLDAAFEQLLAEEGYQAPARK